MFFCNPINIEYRYQFHRSGAICREAADPSVIYFRDRFYLFPSMSGGFYTSDNLADWRFYPLRNVPLLDYAPDVRARGEYLYFCASRGTGKCTFFRTKDPESGVFEPVSTTMRFWDPDLFFDDDGKVYLYWGCSDKKPLYGVELDPSTLTRKGRVRKLIYSNSKCHGFERMERRGPIRGLFHRASRPWIEGAWMTKRQGRYYLQYAAPATESGNYADGVYCSAAPLGPFTYAENNPYSYRPGGFMPGAGHGSTFEDKYGNLWHAATMRISVNHPFERRVGIFPAGFDEDGNLFCNQRYGDWPVRIANGRRDPWEEPELMLLSYKVGAEASSATAGHEPSFATDECEKTWWRAATRKPGEWLEADLGTVMEIGAVQLNFADDGISAEPSDAAVGNGERSIELAPIKTRWLMECSTDGVRYCPLCDKRSAVSDLSHDFVVPDALVRARYIRVTFYEQPFGQPATVSALRVFGKNPVSPPEPATDVAAERSDPLSLRLSWKSGHAVGACVNWGFAPDRLYHSIMVYERNDCVIHALNRGQGCFVRIDGFNTGGITHGDVIEVI